MDFSEFIESLKTNKGARTTKDLYEMLGGEPELEMSLRHFQQIAAGNRPPNQDLLVKLFEIIRPSDRKILVLSFFKSTFKETKKPEALFNYIDQHLTPALESENASMWTLGQKFMIYSDEQLKFLSDNLDALRFHKAVMLYEQIPRKLCPLRDEVLKEMVAMDLVSLSGTDIKPSRNFYRLPSPDISSPRSVARGTDYILKNMELFLSREGNESQVLQYKMQLVKPDVANRIMEQLRAFTRWLESVHSREPSEGDVPIIYFSMFKKVNKRELF